MSVSAWPQEPTKPLTVEEKQDVLGQLLEIPVLKSEIEALKQRGVEYIELRTQERALFADKLAVEKDKTGIAQKELGSMQKERDLARSEAKFYKDSFDVCTSNKKVSFGCKIRRFFSFGIWRCR